VWGIWFERRGDDGRKEYEHKKHTSCLGVHETRNGGLDLAVSHSWQSLEASFYPEHAVACSQKGVQTRCFHGKPAMLICRSASHA